MSAGRERRVSRRGLVVLGATVVGGGIALELAGCAKRTNAPERTGEHLLPTTFTELESIRAVGRKYLELHPSESLAGIVDALKPERGFAALDAEIRKQFVALDVVRVDGWVVARTEARICALVALGP